MYKIACEKVTITNKERLTKTLKQSWLMHSTCFMFYPCNLCKTQQGQESFFPSYYCQYLVEVERDTIAATL